MCVEAATSQFYFSFTSFYKKSRGLPSPAPRTRTTWTSAPRSGATRPPRHAGAGVPGARRHPNPRAPGKFLARDIAYRGMKVVRDRHGRKALFISGVTANEYVPEVARKHPPRLLRTYDGERFHDISVPLIVNRSGDFPDRRPIGYRGLELWRNRLYVVGLGGAHRRRRRVRGPQAVPPEGPLQAGDPDRHARVRAAALRRRPVRRHGQLRGGLRRLQDTQPARRYRFQPVVTGGAGQGGKMVSVLAMYPFRGRLYVGGVSWYSAELRELPASELIRIDRDGQWDVVRATSGQARTGGCAARSAASPRGSATSSTRTCGGWSSVTARSTSARSTGAAPAGERGWADEWSGLVDQALTGEVGFDLWASCNGADWSRSRAPRSATTGTTSASGAS